MSKTPTSWKSELKELASRPADLGLEPGLVRRLDPVAARFPMRIPWHLVNSMDPNNPRDPVRRQLLPDRRELAVGGHADPLTEEPFLVAPGLIQRFEDRLLALVSPACPVHCRHCNRKRFWKNPPTVAGPDEIARALKRRPGIREVILSGGEPLLVPDRKLDRLLEAARSSGQVELARIHTRIPWSLPARITPGLIRTLKRHRPLFVCVHFNHARELVPPVRRALARLGQAGIPLLNQAVLLRGVNDTVRAQLELGRALTSEGVKPHYLFQLDRARGTLHFQVSMPKALNLITRLRNRYSGLLVPHLLVDLPGHHGKVAITPGAVTRLTRSGAVIRAPDNSLVRYSTGDA